MEIGHANIFSINNRSAVLGAACGCYFCMRTFNGNEVRDWTDNGLTALCPHCGIDSVLPGQTDADFLRRACEHWFTATPDD